VWFVLSDACAINLLCITNIREVGVQVLSLSVSQRTNKKKGFNLTWSILWWFSSRPEVRRGGPQKSSISMAYEAYTFLSKRWNIKVCCTVAIAISKTLSWYTVTAGRCRSFSREGFLAHSLCSDGIVWNYENAAENFSSDRVVWGR
jgi:hypothetical protein